MWKGEKFLDLAYKQARLSGELVQSRVLCVFLTSPVCSFLPVPPFTHCMESSGIQEQVTSWPKCSAHTKAVSRWACQELRNTDPVSLWKGTVLSGGPCFTCLLSCPGSQVNFPRWRPSFICRSHLAARVAEEAARPCWCWGLLPGQLAAPSARLPPGMFEQLEHPTGLQSGWGSWDSHLILCSYFKNTSVALLSCLWISAMRLELNCPNSVFDSESGLWFLISSTAKLLVKN